MVLPSRNGLPGDFLQRSGRGPAHHGHPPGLGHSLGRGYSGGSVEPPGFASEDVRSEREIPGSEVRRTGSRPLLCSEQLRGPQAGHQPSLALGLPICAMGRVTACLQLVVARARGPVGILTPASLGLSFLLCDMGEQQGLLVGSGGGKEPLHANCWEQGWVVAWLPGLPGTVVMPQTCQQQAISYSLLPTAETHLLSLASLFWCKCSPFWVNSSKDSCLVVPSRSVPFTRGTNLKGDLLLHLTVPGSPPSPGSPGLASAHLGSRLLGSGGPLHCGRHH